MRPESGSALVLVLILLLIVFGVGGAYLGLSGTNFATALRERDAEIAFAVAESGLDAAVHELNVGIDPGGDGLGAVSGTMGRDTYAVEVRPSGSARFVLRAEGRRDKARRTIVAVVEASEGGADRFRSAVFGDRYVNLAQASAVDSYDSREGDYATAVKDRVRDAPYAGDAGHVRSNGDVRLEPNAKVFGDVTAGENGDVRVDANAHVDASVTRATEPLEVPPVVVPDLPAGPPMAIPSRSLQVLGPGTIRLSELTVGKGATLILEGPATVVVDLFRADTQATLMVDGKSGPVALIGTGEFHVDHTVDWRSVAKNPLELELKLAGAGHATLTGRGEFFGTVYAPNADLSLEGSLEVYGALAARSVSLGQYARVHYDEAVGPATPGPEFRVMSLSEEGAGPGPRPR